MLLTLLSSASSSSSPGRLFVFEVVGFGCIAARSGSGGREGQDEMLGGSESTVEVTARVREKAKRSAELINYEWNS